MASRRPGPGELVAGAGGIVLLLAMFLPWFGVDSSARLPGSGRVITVGGGNVDAWEAFGGIDVVLAASALLAIALLVAALVTEPPGALSMATIAAAALAALLIVLRLIDAPEIPIERAEDTAYDTGHRLGAFLGLLCTAAMALGANRAAAAAPAAREPMPASPPEPSAPQPAPSAGPLRDWTRAAIDADCGTAWRRYDRRLTARYTRYFEEHPELAGDQRASARDLAAALPPGWAELADAVPGDAWERQHLAGRSSQALGVGLLGVAARRDASLAWLWQVLGAGTAAGDPSLEFGHVVDPALLGERPRQTSFDALAQAPGLLVGIEAKWRERGVGACLCRGEGSGPAAGLRCSRRVEQREAYWGAAAAFLGLDARQQGAACPISPAYETVRHAAALSALAGPDRPAVLALVYDADNPYFAGAGGWPGWARILAEASAERADPGELGFTALSWQELVPRLPLDEQTSAWAADKHGLD